jgi:hypothetical protein
MSPYFIGVGGRDEKAAGVEARSRLISNFIMATTYTPPLSKVMEDNASAK